MNKITKMVTGFVTGTILLVSAGASYLYSQRDAVIAKVAASASEYATKALGTKVEIGDIKIGDINANSKSDITVSDLAIYDKNSDLIAKADTAEVNFRLLTLASEPLKAIDEIKIHGVEGNIVKRSDDTWNFNDIKTTGEGESDFNADILIDDISLNAEFDGNELAADISNINMDFDSTAEFSGKVKDAKVSGNVENNEINAEKINLELGFDHDKINTDIQSEKLSAIINNNQVEIDKVSADIKLDEYSNINADVKAQTLGSNVHANINSTDSKQVINVDADTLNLSEFLPLIPEGTIPEGVEILGGIVNDASVNVQKQGDNLKFSGSAKVESGSVKVEQTDIDDINGKIVFAYICS